MNKFPATTPAPYLSVAFFLLAAASALVWVNGVVWAGMLVPSAMLAVISIYWISKRPDFAVVLIVFATAMPRFFLLVPPLKARPEHVVAILLCLTIPFWWLRKSWRPEWIIPDYLVIAYVAMNFFSSLVMSIAPGQTIRWAAQQALAIVPYFILRMVVDRPDRFRRAVKIMLLVGALEAAYGIVSFFSNRLLATEFGIEPEQYGDLPATYGTQYEPNMLGAFCGACCVMMLVMYLFKRERKFLSGYVLTLTGIFVSLSRAAAVATAIAIILVFAYRYRSGLLDKRLTKMVAVASLCVFLIVGPILLRSYIDRFSTISVTDVTADDTALSRAVIIAVAAGDIAKHPILGNGTASLQLLFNWQETGGGEEDQVWLGNAPLRMLHDTGAIGFAVFALFIWYLARRSWNIERREAHPEFIALLASAIVYCITFQATEATNLAFSWTHLGLIACGVAIYGKNLESGRLTPINVRKD